MDKANNKKMIKKEEIAVNIPDSIILSGDGQKIFLVIDAKPNSKSNDIMDITDDGIRVAIAAPPKENEANKELLSFLAEVLNVKKNDLSLDKGSKSKSKIVAVDKNILSRSEVYERLKKHIEQIKDFYESGKFV